MVKFVDDVYEPGMLHLRPVLSSIPRGTITGIRVPDGFSKVVLIQEKDIPGSKEIDVYGTRIPVLAGSQVRYEGEAVCLLCSEEPALLEQAAARIAIDYESDYALEDFDKPREDQLYGDVAIKRGNVGRAFSTASQIVEGEYRQEDPVRDTMAPVGALASFRGDLLSITASTLWPELVRRSVSETLGIPLRGVEVKTVNPFPTDGEKLMLPVYLAVWSALCCTHTGRPVRAVWDTTPATLPFLRTPRSRISIQTALDAKGAVTGEKIEALVDLGAYSVLTDELLRRLAIGAAGSSYRSSVSITVRGVRTSLPPTRLRCGFGISQGIFARELHDSRIAQVLDADPSDRKRSDAENTRIGTGGTVKNRNDRELIRRVCEASDFRRKHAAYQLMKKRSSLAALRGQFRGIGIASGFTGNGFTSKPPGKESWSVSVHLDKNDLLTIRTQGGAYPGSVQDIWKRIGGSILGIDPASVRIESGEGDIPGIGPVVCGQRLSLISALVENCCSAVRKQRFNAPLPITVKKSYRTPPAEVWDREKLKGVPFNRLSWGACVVEVEIDPLSLQPFLRGIWAALDCGELHHPRNAESEIRSSLMKTVRRCTNGDSLLAGRMREGGLHEEFERLVLPPVHISFQEESAGPPSGISQLAPALFPAAFVAALSQASGLYLDSLPVTPERIHSYLSKEGQ